MAKVTARGTTSFDVVAGVTDYGGSGLNVDAAMAERLIGIYERELPAVTDEHRGKVIRKRIAELEGIVAGVRKETFHGIRIRQPERGVRTPSDTA